MARTRNPAQVAEARRLHGLGLSTYAIAAQMGKDPRTVQRWLEDITGNPGHPKRPDVTDSAIVALKREGLSFAEIGRRVHMSTTGARMRYYAATGRERPERAKS